MSLSSLHALRRRVYFSRLYRTGITLPPKRFASSGTTTTTRPCNLQRRNGRRPQSTTTATADKSNNNNEFPYGLKRVDYSKGEAPPRWILPPPPPPSKNPVRRYFGTVTGVAFTAFFVWIYFNQDESIYEYWRSVEQGDVPVDDDDDLDLDLDNVDEWEDEHDHDHGKKQ